VSQNWPLGAGPVSTNLAFGPAGMVVTVVLATLLGGALALSYRRTSAGQYNRDVAQAQIVLAVLMAIVMVVVGDHLSRAFGAVGILSVMRFRVKMQSATEAATLLGAVVVGMASGVGMYLEACVATLGLALLAHVLSWCFVVPAPQGPGNALPPDTGGALERRED